MMPLVGLLAVAGGIAPLPIAMPTAQAQARDTILLRSDVQEANTVTGVVTARGNVQIDYPAQQIRATSAQANYYSNERRIVLSGNVLVNQQGSTLRAEVVTYLIDEGRFVAMPTPNQQVETRYLLPPSQPASAANGSDPRPPAARPPMLLDVSPVESAPESAPLDD